MLSRQEGKRTASCPGYHTHELSDIDIVMVAVEYSRDVSAPSCVVDARIVVCPVQASSYSVYGVRSCEDDVRWRPPSPVPPYPDRTIANISKIDRITYISVVVRPITIAAYYSIVHSLGCMR